MATKKKARLTVTLPSDAPPTEFRIFKRGLNETSKGTFLFDDEAARLCMAAYRKAGVDIMFDLEHLSLDSESENYDPDAYGWCKLEVRNGELWAVAVSWTEEGAARLKSKKSRYISPAFHYLTDGGRVTEIYNIAICAVPATYETPALVAASKRVGKQIGTLTVEVTKMDVLKKIAAALGIKEDATLEEVLAALKALQDGDGGGEETEETTEDEETEETTEDDEESDDAATAAALSASNLNPKLQAKILAATSGQKVLLARLAKLELKQTTSAVQALIAANVDKLPKGLEKWAQGQSVESLTVYFKNAQPVRQEAKKEPKRPAGAVGAGTTEDGEVVLTAEDLKVAKLTGATKEEMIASKKALRERKKDKAQVEAID